jgi:hypothetical protein
MALDSASAYERLGRTLRSVAVTLIPNSGKWVVGYSQVMVGLQHLPGMLSHLRSQHTGDLGPLRKQSSSPYAIVNDQS